MAAKSTVAGSYSIPMKSEIGTRMSGTAASGSSATPTNDQSSAYLLLSTWRRTRRKMNRTVKKMTVATTMWAEVDMSQG